MFDYRVIFVAWGTRAGRLAALGIAAGLLVSIPGSAQAQFFGWLNPPTAGPSRSAMIPPKQIYRRLAGRGYRIRGRLHRNGRVYLADVIDRWGRAMRLVIDAYHGNILQRFATAPPRPAVSSPQARADLYSRYPAYPGYPQYPGYPAYPYVARPPAAGSHSRSRSIPRVRHGTTSEKHRSHTRKTRTATRETGAPAVRSSPSAHQVRAVARPSVHSARSEAAVKAGPTTVSTSRPAAASRKSAPPKTEGPGYANGVPINPLD